MFELHTAYAWPWSQKNPRNGSNSLYGRCARCGNAMQLINIDNNPNSPRPHGRHRPRKVEGFAYQLEKILNCPDFTGTAKDQTLQSLKTLTPEADGLRRSVPERFDVMVKTFGHATGLFLSSNLAITVLESFLAGRRYCWPTLTQANLPWLFCYTQGTFPIYGQQIRQDSALAASIRENVKGATFNRWGRLQAMPSAYFKLEFGLRFHELPADAEDPESVQFYVVDVTNPTNTALPGIIETRLAEFAFEAKPRDSEGSLIRTRKCSNTDGVRIIHTHSLKIKPAEYGHDHHKAAPATSYGQELRARAKDVLERHLHLEGGDN